MKTQIIPLATEPIESFAERHNLTMVVRQRHHEDNATKWYARFDKCEMKEGSLLVGVYGDGCTPEHAMSTYAERISGTTLVFDAFGERREINCPRLQ